MLLSRTLRLPTSILQRASRFQCLKTVALIPQRAYASSPSVPPVELKKTPLHNLHVANGAKMVPFAGYSMPVVYSSQGVGESHKWVREKSGLFDVSHMVQHRISGPGALSFLHSVTPSDLVLLQPHQSTLSVFLHPVTGGIVDDLIITRHGPHEFFVVTNAACKDKDLAYIKEHLEKFISDGGEAVAHEVLENWGLIALQGPLSREVLQEFLENAGAPDTELDKLFFGFSTFAPSGCAAEKIHIARGGYTGEDGFEISLPPTVTTAVTDAILEIGKKGDRVKLAGLGARDSLRLEAGMCLYGHDLDDTTTPIEAGLKWLVGKNRVAEGGYLGAETVNRQYNDWKLVERRRVGFTIEGAPAREGAVLINPENESTIGKITSGCPSPSLGKNIAMGYIASGFHKTGTEVGVLVRGKVRKGVVTKMPFVPAKYYKGS